MIQSVNSSGTAKYEMIREQLRQRISSGRYTGKLPGERVLAREFDVNFLTVRKSMPELVEEGLIERISGKGTFVKRPRKLAHTLSAIFSSSQGPIHSVLIHSIEEAAAKHGFDMIFKATDNERRPVSEIFGSFKGSHKMDGLISWRHEDAALATGLSYVAVMECDPRYAERCSSVRADDYFGASLAVKHLLELGHRKIAIALPNAGDHSVFIEERLKAYRDCMIEAGLTPNAPLQIPGNWTVMNQISPITEGRGFLSQLSKFTAVFCFNDALAGEIIKYLRRNHVKVPEDISIVGYDDTEFAWALDITSVKQPIAKIGEKAVEILVSHIHNKAAPVTHLKLSPELIIRKTTDLPMPDGIAIRK